MCDICTIPDSECMEINGVCGLHDDGFTQNHTDDGKPVCDWFGWMFTHDDHNNTCKGCKK